MSKTHVHTVLHPPATGNGWGVCECGATLRFYLGRPSGEWHACKLCSTEFTAVEDEPEGKAPYGCDDFGQPLPHPGRQVALDAGQTVDVENLAVGDVFRSSSGETWRYLRPDGALVGVYHVERVRDGLRSTFAGCAAVLVL